MSDPISQLGLTCPSGGNFYICQGTSTQFLGCCTSDPCEDGKGTCPQSDLRTSSFNESAYTSIQSQACASSSAGKWYTCSQLDTPFLGCCSTNACDSGCPTKDLVAAKLSDDQKSASVFETTSATVATASGTSGTSVPTSSSSASSNPSATATAATQNASTSGLSTGAKVGIVVSAAIVAIALLAVLAVFGRRYLKKRRGVVVTGSPPNAIMSNPTNSYLYHDPNRILYTPPPMSSPSLEPLAAARASRSPTESDVYPLHDSAKLSPSWTAGAVSVSKHSSVDRSAEETNPTELRPSSLSQQKQQQEQQEEQEQFQAQPTAELEGMVGPDTPGSSSGLPGTPPWSARLQSHPPSMYRPYRPSMQEFADMKSGLYP